MRLLFAEFGHRLVPGPAAAAARRAVSRRADACLSNKADPVIATPGYQVAARVPRLPAARWARSDRPRTFALTLPVIPFRDPFQELGHAVNLIVMTTVRKGQDFRYEVVQPWSLMRQNHVTRLDLGGLCGDTFDLFTFRSDGNRPPTKPPILTKILNKPRA